MKYRMLTLGDAVALCEQLADDLVSFNYDARLMTIETLTEVPDETREILERRSEQS